VEWLATGQLFLQQSFDGGTIHLRRHNYDHRFKSMAGF
jgi:hypothetical protein